MNSVLIKILETEEEIQQKAYVSWKGWQEAYAGILDQSFLDTLTLERNLRNAKNWKDNTIIAKDGDRVIGFVVCGPCRDEDLPDAGEVYAIYILSEYYDQLPSGSTLLQYPALIHSHSHIYKRARRCRDKERDLTLYR